MSDRPQMRSPRGIAGALVLLIGAPGAIAAQAIGASADLLFHFVLGASFALLAFAVFDFNMPRWLQAIFSAAIGALAVIFLLQGVADLIQSAPLQSFAYDVLGQRLEKILGYAFILWCAALFFMDSRGPTKIIGGVVLLAVIGVEIYSAVLTSSGHEAPGALKLTYLLLFVWLLLESLKRSARL